LVQAHLQGLSPCGPREQLEILDTDELAFDSHTSGLLVAGADLAERLGSG